MRWVSEKFAAMIYSRKRITFFISHPITVASPVSETIFKHTTDRTYVDWIYERHCLVYKMRYPLRWRIDTFVARSTRQVAVVPVVDKGKSAILLLLPETYWWHRKYLVFSKRPSSSSKVSPFTAPQDGWWDVCWYDTSGFIFRKLFITQQHHGYCTF